METGEPVCKPIRTFTATPGGQECSARSRCAVNAAATACVAVGKTMKQPSPSVATKRPPLRSALFTISS